MLLPFLDIFSAGFSNEKTSSQNDYNMHPSHLPQQFTSPSFPFSRVNLRAALPFSVSVLICRAHVVIHYISDFNVLLCRSEHHAHSPPTLQYPHYFSLPLSCCPHLRCCAGGPKRCNSQSPAIVVHTRQRKKENDSGHIQGQSSKLYSHRIRQTLKQFGRKSANNAGPGGGEVWRGGSTDRRRPAPTVRVVIFDPNLVNV